jgi:branched-chain amino acid transport system substrate-binding protein
MTPSLISRSRFIGSIFAAIVLSTGSVRIAHAEPGVTSEAIVLGQSTALSGPLGDLGQEINKGVKVYFDALNAKGGVNGRQIKLITRDDTYAVPKTIENIEGFIKEDNILAFFGTFGTPNNEALIPLAKKASIPVFFPYSGSSTIRQSELRGVFNLRASYPDEAEKLIANLKSVGVKKIAVAYQNNSFGREVLAATVEAMKKFDMKPIMTASVENNASNAETSTSQLLAVDPEAIVLGLAGKPSVEIIKLVNQRRKGTQLYALSVLATPANLKALGKDGTGVAISQVMPFPRNATLALVREYQQAMAAAGQTELSHISLEGYANARVMAEALRRAGKQPTRAGLIAAMEGLRLNLGGLETAFVNGAASGSNFVELTMISSQGKLIK